MESIIATWGIINTIFYILRKEYFRFILSAVAAALFSTKPNKDF